MIYYMNSLVWLVFSFYPNQMSHQTMFPMSHLGTKFQYNYVPYGHVIIFTHCIIMTQCGFQLFFSLVYHEHHIRRLWMLIFQGEINDPGYDRLFPSHPLLNTHSNQEHDNAMHHPPFPERFILFLCEDRPTGSAYFTYICSWLSSCRRFWIFNRSCFLFIKHHHQCVILWSNVWSVAYRRCCKPHRSKSNQRILYYS